MDRIKRTFQNRIKTTGLLALLLCGAWLTPGWATFGSGGFVMTSIQWTDNAYCIILQPDGKLVVAGDAYQDSYESNDFCLVRYNSDGSLDSGFGTGGKVVTQFGSDSDYIYGLGLQPDGMLVAAGYSYNYGYTFALARYTASGGLDSGFGSGGKVTTSFISGSAAYDVALQTDGKIIAAGYQENSYGSNGDFALARYNSNGSLDTGFGTGGKVITAMASGTNYDMARSVIVQADGKIVAAGYAGNGSNNDIAVARYDSNGILDSSFGIGGKVTTTAGSGDDMAYDVVQQSDGKLVVSGYAYNGSNFDFCLVRYNSDGSLDTAFGTGGKVLTPLGPGNDEAFKMVIQPDGKLVIAGYSANASGYSDFALARYNTDGSLDAGFGAAGKVVHSFSSYDNAYDLVLQPDGKIAAAGTVMGSDWNFGVARFNANGTLDIDLTATPSATVTKTITPTATATWTGTGTCTPTFTPTATPTPSSTATNTPENTPTATCSPTVSDTATPTGTMTATPEDTPTATLTATPTLTTTATATVTATPEDTRTLTPTSTSTLTHTLTATVTVTTTGTATLEDNRTATTTPTPLVTLTFTRTAVTTPTPTTTARVTVDFSGIDLAGKTVLAYPNPANREVKFFLRLEQAAPMKLKIFNFCGELAAAINAQLPAGPGQILTWNCSQAPSGIYLVMVYQDNQPVQTLKISVVH